MLNDAKGNIDTIQNKVNLGIVNLTDGCSCSESIMVTYGQEFGLTREIALRIASGFGGGMGLMGETCGAVTAAFMIIGLKFGASNIEDAFARENTYELVAEFARRFKSIRGSITCRELLGGLGGLDLSSPEGRKYIRESGLTPQIVADVIRILEEMFYENCASISL